VASELVVDDVRVPVGCDESGHSLREWSSSDDLTTDRLTSQATILYMREIGCRVMAYVVKHCKALAK
jgi:hypothetical protein